MRVLNGREFPIGLAGKVVVPVRKSVGVGLHSQISRLDVFMQSGRRSVDAEVIEGAEREEVSDR